MRHERAVLLRLLHRLRSLAHVIDMHRLTKDPERVKPTYAPTDARRRLDPTKGRFTRDPA